MLAFLSGRLLLRGMFLILLVYLFVAGIFLTWMPWTHAWEANYFVLLGNSFLGGVLSSAALKAWVSAFGVVHLILGAQEAALRSRERGEGKR